MAGASLVLEIRCKGTAFWRKDCAQFEHFLFGDAKIRRIVVADS